jgi:hypothetical protein
MGYSIYKYRCMYESTKVSCLNRHYDVVVALLYGSTSGSTFESTFGSTSGSMPYLHIILYLRRYRILPEVLSGTFVPSKIEYFRKYFQSTKGRIIFMYCTGTVRVRVLGGGVGDRVGDQGAVGRPALRTCTMYESTSLIGPLLYLFLDNNIARKRFSALHRNTLKIL